LKEELFYEKGLILENSPMESVFVGIKGLRERNRLVWLLKKLCISDCFSELKNSFLF